MGGLRNYLIVTGSYWAFTLSDGALRMLVLLHFYALGYTPFAPLAGGRLTGKYRRGEPPPPGSRMTVRPEGAEHYRSGTTFDALEALEREAAERGVSMAALAIAWLLHVPEVTAVVVGPNTVEQLAPVVEALDVALDSSAAKRVQEASNPSHGG